MATLWKWLRFVLVEETKPIKTTDYFVQLGCLHDDIDSALEHKDRNRLLQYGVVLVPAIVTVAIYGFFYRSPLTHFEAIIWMDVFGWANSDSLMYVVVSIHILLGAYYLYLCYISKAAKHFRDTFQKVIVRAESIRFHWPYHYKNRDCSTLVRKIFVRVFQCLQTIITALVISAFLALIYYWKFLYTNRHYFLSTPWHLLQILQSHMLALNFAISYLVLFHSMNIVGTFGIVELFICQIQYWQIRFAINSYNSTKRKPGIGRIMASYRRFLLYIFTINPVVGKLFMAFLLVSAPSNGLLIKMLDSKDVTQYSRIVLILLCVYQYICIFGTHFMFAKRNSELRTLSKAIMLTPFHHRMAKTTRIRVNLFTESMFTKRKYGLTYWKFGQISMMSFVKFILLFSEMIMYVYQIKQQQQA